VASQKSNRSRQRQRRRRSPDSAPRAVSSSRRDERAERLAEAERSRRRARRQLGAEGERPVSPFGGLPVSEAAILLGLIGAVVGFASGNGAALIVGVVVCAIAVCEISAREHLSGYRSHTALLAGIPAVAVGAGVAALIGAKQRELVLVVVVPLYAVLFWALRRHFLAARQARAARAARGGVPQLTDSRARGGGPFS
jgi:hypothetical protein